MEPGFRSPLIDFFRRGEVARDVRLLAAQGALAPRAHEQLALLVLLSDDADPDDRGERQRDARRAAGGAAPGVPRAVGRARRRCATSSRRAASAPGDHAGAPTSGRSSILPTEPAPTRTTSPTRAEPQVLSTLSIIERMKLAMKGTREQRAQLIRDSNKLVAAAVLSSPKLTEAEVEAFAKMAQRDPRTCCGSSRMNRVVDEELRRHRRA